MPGCVPIGMPVGGAAVGGRATGALPVETGETVVMGPAPGAMPTAARTRSMKDWLSNGLTMWPEAPEARARFSSKGSKVPASSMTGVWALDGSERIACATS